MKLFTLFAFLFFIPIYGIFSICDAKESQTIYQSLFLLNSNSSASRDNALKSMLSKIIEEFEAPGASMVIKFRDGSIFQHAIGVADTTSGEPLTIQDYFRIGSATKTFTGIAALLLWQDDLIDLDDTVESILPNLTEFVPMHGKGITVRMLLNHTSGLADYPELPEGKPSLGVVVANPEKNWSPEELVAIAVNHGLQSVPGTTFNYSNTNYILLGLIIEKQSNMDYETFVAKRLLEPLQLRHTVFSTNNGFPGKYAHGYLEKDGDGILYDYSVQNPTYVWSAGSIISTIPDLLIWLESLMEGELLQKEVRDEQFNFVLDDQGNGYGLGVAAMGHAFGHNGSVLGYQTWMFRFQDVYFIIYTNCYYGTKDNLAQTIFERSKKIIFTE